MLTVSKIWEYGYKNVSKLVIKLGKAAKNVQLTKSRKRVKIISKY